MSAPVPTGWVEVPVDQVAEVRLGRQRSPARAVGEHMRPYLRAANVTWKGLDISDVKEMDFTPAELEIYGLKPGDVLLAEASGSASEVGKPAVWNGEIEDCCFQNTLIRVRSRGPLPRFLHYHFLCDALTGRISTIVRGVGIHHLGAQGLSSFPIRIAPLEEEKRIVAEIEKQFTRLDAGTEALKRVQANLKRYRSSILQAACQGRLVPAESTLAKAEGRDYEPATVLLGRAEANGGQRANDVSLLSPSNEEAGGLWSLPAGWAWAVLGQVITGIEAGKSFKCEERPPEANEVGVVKVSAVTWGEYDESESKTCTTPALVQERWFVRPGDFLFSRANTIELVGACVIVRGVRRRVMLSDKILRLGLTQVEPRWILYVLRSQHGRSEIERLATGNQESMRNIGQDRIRSIRIPIPPVAEQRRIVEELDRRFSLIEQLGGAIDLGVRRSLGLRKAVLRTGFEGNLVPQDKNDESAAVLLDRIKREWGQVPLPDPSSRRPPQKLPLEA